MVNDHTSRTSTLINFERDRTLAARRSGKTEAVLVIATPNEITAAGMETVLHASGYRVAARCSSENDLLRSLDAYRPDIIMLAENLVGGDIARTVSRLRARNCSVAMIFLLDEHESLRASVLLDLDVEGILLSVACSTSLIDCVKSVHHGRKWLDPALLRHLATAERSPQIASSLTLREADIVHLVSRGLRNKEIASKLHLSEGTVKMHLHHIYAKLRIGSRTQLAMSMAGAWTPGSNSETRQGEPTALDSATAARLQPKTSA
ncbi:response regulator transcription factor [Bradyrhizobium vignae]|uniref:Regulatory protein LuxR (Modular protein) n=1 Tax=Bradyrhizobium vignae TaxID=1549949 RepID=A0A2U3PVG6_9BRAD|nr:response regulator transcription factor [Bradyrhizobium vignae]SPP93116.1 Regulatory protein LuxR (modular protein) [Bradyrhizobium vignae]